MEVLVANVEHLKFDVEVALEAQYGALPLPFPGMDSQYINHRVFTTFQVIPKLIIRF